MAVKLKNLSRITFVNPSATRLEAEDTLNSDYDHLFGNDEDWNFKFLEQESDDANRPFILTTFRGITYKLRVRKESSIQSVSADWLEPRELRGKIIYAPYISAMALMYKHVPYYKNGKMTDQAMPGILDAFDRELSVYLFLKEHSAELLTQIREDVRRQLNRTGLSVKQADAMMRKLDRWRFFLGRLIYSKFLKKFKFLRNKRWHDLVFKAVFNVNEKIENAHFIFRESLMIEDYFLSGRKPKSLVRQYTKW